MFFKGHWSVVKRWLKVFLLLFLVICSILIVEIFLLNNLFDISLLEHLLSFLLPDAKQSGSA
jgi:hypothetical protein